MKLQQVLHHVMTEPSFSAPRYHSQIVAAAPSSPTNFLTTLLPSSWRPGVFISSLIFLHNTPIVFPMLLHSIGPQPRLTSHIVSVFAMLIGGP